MVMGNGGSVIKSFRKIVYILNKIWWVDAINYAYAKRCDVINWKWFEKVIFTLWVVLVIGGWFELLTIVYKQTMPSFLNTQSPVIPPQHQPHQHLQI
ncbi:hypothetical protein HanRHA438_Chr13g0592701 [Helianthus annuus]|uniref:Uncharacterized protein n=1 Tax=Helianthus annuus TaxID=4232 RepID=A0A251SRD8_HELAN|nr:hypothetical protein HanXRQr2_Chr13g0581931 [Helianthus annuus]KAJ0848654.1 hypothetical protein HanPSC8_Chr13g0560061 [Helianthus annuus]KAJ0857659.1 hypothetical protein HanRHA438_Chr13g0592701 [Helianthus annuus]